MAPNGCGKQACTSRGREAGRDCICTVCTCGCHKCPQKHTSVYTKYGDITTEYTAKYPEWPMPQPPPRKPASPRPCTAPMSSATTYRDTYIPHPISRRSSPPCRPPARPCQKNDTDYRTTYDINYWDKSSLVCTPQHKAPQPQHMFGKQFEGQSVYKLEFPNHGPQACQKPERPPAGSLNTVKSRMKFDGDSTYHDDYRQWAIPLQAKCARKCEYSPPQGRNECGPTTYQTDYVGRRVQPCPVLTRDKPTDRCGDHMCY